ncbi:MAG: hypothetical protein ACJ73S_29270 [Mycobacteriales bacterium]
MTAELLDPGGWQEFDTLCRNAVGPLEVAAGLEAAGLSDRLVRQRYGYADVFALGERMYADTERRPDTPPPPDPPWRPRPGRHLLRGALFALPGLCVLGGAPALGGGGPWRLLLALGLPASWGVAQCLAALGYTRPFANAGLLRWGLLAGTVLAVLAALAGVLALPAGRPLVLFTAAQAEYLLAATVLLVREGEWWLVTALVPAAGAGGLALAGPLPPGAALAGAGVSLAAVAVLAWVRTRGARPSRPTRREWRIAVPHGLAGTLAGGLVGFGAVAGGRDAAGFAMAALPLSVSMGPAEWLLVAYRRRTATLLHATTRLPDFARRARRALLAALCAYLATLAGLEAGLAALGGELGVLAVAGQVLLGGLLFVALGLLATGQTRTVMAVMSAALSGEHTFVADRWPADLAQVAAVGGACGLLLGYGLRAFGRPTTHE